MGLQIDYLICYFVKYYIMVMCYASNPQVAELANLSNNKITTLGAGIFAKKSQLFVLAPSKGRHCLPTRFFLSVARTVSQIMS